MTRYILICIILINLSFAIKAQPPLSTKSKKAIALFGDAQEAFNGMNFDEAIQLLDEAIKKDVKFIEAYLMQAEVFHDQKKYKEEIEKFTFVIELDPEYSPMIYSRRGQASLKIGKYSEAKKDLDKYLNYPNTSKELRVSNEFNLECAEFGINALQNPVPFKPVNLGNMINSYLHEYWPSLTADEKTMIFTIEVPKPGVSPDAPRSQMTHQEDLYVSHWENGAWTRAYNIGNEINTTGYNEGTQAFSVDGQHLFYTVCNKPGDYGRCDLYYSRKIGEKWTLPENIGPPLSTKAWESHPSFSSDGKTLYFTSNRSGGSGEMDIWISTMKDDGSWTPPENLGKNINSKGFEMSPYIHPDNNTLYFASNGHIGMGGMDIYYSRKNADGSWGKPVNLGYPINTFNEEMGMIVNARGQLAYFASDRYSDNGRDIYQFDLYEDVRPNLVTYVKGKVYDAATKKAIGADFELTDLESKEMVVEAQSDESNGKYLVCLPSERDYAFNIFKKGYMFHSETFTLKNFKDTSNTYFMDFALHKIDVNTKGILKNIFFDTDSYELKPKSYVELDKLVRFMSENPELHIEIGGHTDNEGTKELNQVLSLNRAKSVYLYLISNNIPEFRLTYKGYDFTEPIATNDTEEGRAKNRRTEVKITKVGE